MKNFSLTSNAAKQIKILLKGEKKGSFFRVTVLGGGCSGFQYDFSFSNAVNKDDIKFNNFGVDFIIDKQSIEFLNGSKLDYVEELVGSFFRINNPNATANCGCGTSFSI